MPSRKFKAAPHKGFALIESLLALPLLALIFVMAFELLEWMRWRSAARYSHFVAARSATVYWRSTQQPSAGQQQGQEAAFLAWRQALGQNNLKPFTSVAPDLTLHFQDSPHELDNPIVHLSLKASFDHPCHLTSRLAKQLGLTNTNPCAAFFPITTRLPAVLQGYGRYE